MRACWISGLESSFLSFASGFCGGFFLVRVVFFFCFSFLSIVSLKLNRDLFALEMGWVTVGVVSKKPGFIFLDIFRFWARLVMKNCCEFIISQSGLFPCELCDIVVDDDLFSFF